MEVKDYISRLAPLPPHDKVAEKEVLTGILALPHLLPKIKAILREDDFYFDCHQRIYRAICEVADSSHDVDFNSLIHALLLRAPIADVEGGEEYIRFLFFAKPLIGSDSIVINGAHAVRVDAISREVIRACYEVLQKAYESPNDDTAIDAHRKFTGIVRSRGADMRIAGDVTVNELVDAIAKRMVVAR